MSPTEHAADQAGGEVIFSSDGAQPLPAVRPPAVVAKQDIVGDAELDNSPALSAAQAFEVFSGKLYNAPIGSARTTVAVGSALQESPLERLARLQQELTELEQDVSGGDAQEDVERTVRDLQARLEQTASLWPQRQEQLQQQVEQALAGGEAKKTSAAATASTPSVATPELEERLRRLEMAIGSSDNAVSSNTALVDRLAHMETLLSKLDDTQLQATFNKTKVIRQDLEAASKARNKLLKNETDSKQISELYAALQDVSGMTTHLPVLAQRLQSLASLHQSQALQERRLVACEQTAAQLQSTLRNVESSATQLETGFQTNAAQIQANLAALDELLQQLPKT